MQRETHYFVASGTYYVGGIGPLTLQAILGTCVGVALYDPEADVGGMIHLLLPEPISAESPDPPEKFASSGLPLFLQALYAAGASRENLKAAVAGGALVGPIQDYDLVMDIGGRTAEQVMQFLNKKQIQIEKWESGGFFTCRLSLDMQTWSCRIEPSGWDKLTEATAQRLPTPEEISRTTQNLQPIPQVALKILRIVNAGTFEIGPLAEEVRKDQVISARTLQLCNSVMYAGRHKIDSLDHALVMLGQKLLVKFVISAAVNRFFTQSDRGYSLCKGGMYHHAVGTAIIAEKLAELTGMASTASAYTAGLLHDIGKVVLDQYIHSAFPLFYRHLHEEGHDFVEAEKKILRTDHTQVGGRLAVKWCFPDSLVKTIRFHHQPEKATRFSELVHIVYLADLLMSRFHAGLEVERVQTDALASRLEAVGLSLVRLPEIVDLIPVKVFESSPEVALMTGG
ncbi:MAG: HDOD domain-containing protein [Desulfobacterales bacterium]|nr:MAG: HDOD domain-containing protein [Desulfobacterales bacterium]